MNDEQFQLARRAMNIGHQELFNMVTINIQDQLNGAKQQLLRFFTGGAGVGKTFLLNLFKNQINRCFGKNAVRIGALTGAAARLIGGSTLHSLLKLSVQRDGIITRMGPLTGN